MAYTDNPSHYCYLCTLCQHPAARHLLIGGHGIEGPYQCHMAGCSCEMTQSTPCTVIDRVTYERRFPELVVPSGR